MPRRARLPQPQDRLPLGRSGLKVSPFCLGMTKSPRTVLAAYDAGVNFFFLSADLHWPLYEGTRKGLAWLLARGGSIRDELVVGVTSYLDQPLFGAMVFNEVLDQVRGLDRVDVLIAGAVCNENGFMPRVEVLTHARQAGWYGARAIGASFHQRVLAVPANNQDLLDISFVRYNSAHPGARVDLFPHLQPRRSGQIFNFKSCASHVKPRRFKELGLDRRSDWLPAVTDHYRFVLSQPGINGVLFSPKSAAELERTFVDLEQGRLSADEQSYMMQLATAAFGPGPAGA